MNLVKALAGPLTGLALIALSLTLAACGEKKESAQPAGDPIAAVAAPAGTSWSETFTQAPDGHFLMGNPNAKVKLAEYGSYTCSHCAEFSKEASAEIRKLVDTGKINYELRNYVRDPIDISVALLARCGGKDVFYPLSEQFFANQAPMFEKVQALGDAPYQAIMASPPQQRFGQLAQGAGLIDFAKQRGIAEDQARTCLADTAAAADLAKGVEAANAQYQITGTPSFLINGVLVDTPPTWKDLRAELRRAGI